MSTEYHATTLELTNEFGTFVVSLNRTVVTLNDLHENLIEPVLKAAGYPEELLREFYGED